MAFDQKSTDDRPVTQTFSSLELLPRLIRALEEQGFTEPTPVQSQAIPIALSGKDMLVSAATGTGKTVAFLLPIIQQLMANKSPRQGSRCLILAPTRELAKQLFKQCEKLVQYTYLKPGLFIGGEDFKFQAALLRKDPEIIIATPGRILELITKEAALVSHLEHLVLDEADTMLELGFEEDVAAIAGHCGDNYQTLMFSATLDRKGVKHLAMQLLNEPETLIVDSHRQQRENIKQEVILADDLAHKKNLLAWLLENETFEKAIVFTNTKTQTTALRGFLRGKKFRAACLNSDMSQEERSAVMANFRSHHTRVLVATDVASRGLDISSIDLVINFDMARNGDDYVHRIGRTGRVETSGHAVSFVMSNEWNLMVAIERYTRTRFIQRTVSAFIGRFKGPKKLKNSGKIASKTKRNKTTTKDKKITKAARKKAAVHKPMDGFAPMKKKPGTKPK